MSIETLIRKQNRDGGWPYDRGGSATEPTVYAVLSLLATGEREAALRGVEWLRRIQRADGGWPPRPGVDESNWATALVALLPRETLGALPHSSAIAWLMGTTGFESTVEYRARQWLLGGRIPRETDFAGWPWIPGAAAWVGPTSIAIMALEKELRRRPLIGIHERIEAGRKFLLVRACRDGGWNHGSVRALGREGKPYPETTGMALTALRGVRSPEIDASLKVARQFLQDCRSADGQNWLRLGLAAHGQLPEGYCRPADLSFRTVPDASLDILTSDADLARNLFWC